MSRPRGEDGMSLAELLVVMLVGSVVMLGVAVMIVSTLRSSTTTNNRLETMNAGRTALDAMTRSLRTAVQPSQLSDVAHTDTAFVAAQGDGVQFFADLQNVDESAGPSRVSYALSAGRLTETVQRADPRPAGVPGFTWCTPGVAGCAVTTRLLAVNVTGPLFTFYGPTGVALPLAGSCLGLPCLAAAALPDVSAVEVRIALAGQAVATAPTSTYVSRVSLPNHDAVLAAAGAP